MSSVFKFRYVVNGQPQGMFATQGTIGQEGLELGKGFLPYRAVIDSVTRDDRLILTLDVSDPDIGAEVAPKLQDHFLVLAVNGGLADSLEKAIDRFASAIEAEARKTQLTAEGRAAEFRSAICPCCKSTVDLSELPVTPYSYCRFCETVFGEGLDRLKSTNNYRECDECGYHDRVQGYGEFYFYFLLVIYGFRHKRRHMCDACGSSLSTKLLLMNSIFLLGVPNAVACAFRARAGKDAELASLSSGNALAKKGKMDKAIPLYNKALEVFPGHPGVHYNRALGHLSAKNINEGLEDLRKSVETCPSYLPALRLIQRLSS